jgi:hypothetical protein
VTKKNKALRLYVRVFKVGRKQSKVLNKTFTINTYSDYVAAMKDIRSSLWEEYVRHYGRVEKKTPARRKASTTTPSLIEEYLP